MSPGKRVLASVVFSISVTLVLMLAISQFPGLEIPLPYWIFGVVCPALISFVVTMQLVRQTERIRDLQRQREDFLQLLSHDMRAPQASIIALLDSPSARQVPDLAQPIRNYAERTLKLADDMVQLSRAQLLQFKPEALNIVDIGHDAVDALAPQARARGIRVEETCDDSEILVQGEPSLLARAFINLLDNAVKFSPDLSVIRFAISRVVQDRRELVVCSVIDAGAGIPDDQMAALFQPFERARSGPAGAGLGLAFVKTVVTRHGGTIQCVSPLGGGTTFRVALPAMTGPAPS